MLKINHRINTLEDLVKTPRDWGIEVDIRDSNGEIICAHDAFEDGIPLSTLLEGYQHALIIFNTKSDGLVKPILELVKKYEINRYFFLDLANPTMIQLMRSGNPHFAVRYSEYEPLAFAEAFAGKAEWVWIDCFNDLPLDQATYQRLATHFKLCLVSPELQGHPRPMIDTYKSRLKTMPIQAVCSDFCEDWSTE